MSCLICEKYESVHPLAIAEYQGIALSHIAASDDGLAMRGRLIIEPMRHVVNPEDLTPEEFANMGILLQKAMRLLKQALGAEHVYFFRINELVKHFHFHVVARYPGTPKDSFGLKILEWAEYPKLNDVETQRLAELLRHHFK